MRRKAGQIVRVLLFGLLAGCAAKAPPPVPGWVAEANTPFGLALFDALWKGPHGPNVIVSPVSVGLALTMTMNGAGGTTRDAMLKTLHLDDRPLDEINAGFQAALAAFDAPGPKVRLRIANSLWGDDGIDFHPEFLARNKTAYRAELRTLDLQTPDAMDQMNAWVRKQTGGLIKSIIEPPIDPATLLVLINAVYFKGEWQHQFDRKRTEPGEFATLDGTKKIVPMMWQSHRFPYQHSETFEAISLPFGEGRFSLLVFLPAEDSSLRDLLHSLTAENWARWMAGFAETEIGIRLPRFTVEFSAKLNDVLTGLGMGNAFSPGADFGPMFAPGSGSPAWIDVVRHKTFLEVDEEGARAAAATSANVAGIATPFLMSVDRPFFVAIRDTHSGLLLLAGVIGDPTATAP